MVVKVGGGKVGEGGGLLPLRFNRLMCVLVCVRGVGRGVWGCVCVGGGGYLYDSRQ